VIQVGEGVAQVIDGVAEALDQVASFHVVDDETRVVIVDVVHETGVLVAGELGGGTGVALDQLLLVSEVACTVVLHLLEEDVGFLDEHLEFEKLGFNDVLLLGRQGFRVNHSRVLEALKKLAGGQLDKLAERFLNVEALRARKNLELFSINDEFV